ncbi:MAG: GNAT family N-acetyltransferase [Polyangiaceae bacterium]
MKAIRQLAASDQTDVLRINAESLPGVARLDENEIGRLLHLPNSHLAAEGADHTVLGYALAFPSDAPYDGEEFHFLKRLQPEPFLYIDQVAVGATARRAGVASALYEALATYARHRRLAAMCCEVNLEPPNPGSLAFHQDAGFHRIGQLQTADGRTVVLMIKPLRTTEERARDP